MSSDQSTTFVLPVQRVESVEWDVATYVIELRRKGYREFTRTSLQPGRKGLEVLIYAKR